MQLMKTLHLIKFYNQKNAINLICECKNRIIILNKSVRYLNASRYKVKDRSLKKIGLFLWLFYQ